MKKVYKISLISLSIALPIFADAQLQKVDGLFMSALGIVTNRLVPLAFVLALLFFFWGIATYIWSEENKKEIAQKRMIWGIVALFVMSTVWGLVYFIRDNLNITTNPSAMPIPTTGGSGTGSPSGGQTPGWH